MPPTSQIYSRVQEIITEHLGAYEPAQETINRLAEALNKEFWTSSSKLDSQLALDSKSLTEEVLPPNAVQALISGLEEYGIDSEFLKQSNRISEVVSQLASELKRCRSAELNQSQSEAIVKSIIDSALDAVIVINECGIITEWNQQAERTFGWSRSWALGKLLSETIIPEEFKEAHIRGMKHFLATGEGPVLNKRIEITAVDKWGRVFPVELTIIPIQVDGAYFFSSFVRDLSEIKKTEQTLKAINELAISLLAKKSLEEIGWTITKNTIELLGLEDCVIYVLDEETQILHQIAAYGAKNPQGEEIANQITLKVGEGIVGKVAKYGEPMLVSDTRLFPEYVSDDASRLSELAVPILFEQKVIGVIDSEHPESDYYKPEHLEVFTTIASLTSSTIKSAINHQKTLEAEKSLKESEERWQNLVENMPEAIQISKEGSVIYMNPAGLALYEADTLEEVKELDLVNFANSVSSHVFEERLELLRIYGFVDPIEFEITTLKGKTRFIESNSTSIYYEGEVAIQSVLRDITEKKLAEQELQHLSSRLSTLIDNLNAGILMENPDGTIVHANTMFCALFGGKITPEFLKGQPMPLIFKHASEQFELPSKFVKQMKALLAANTKTLNTEFTLKNGHVYEIDFIPVEIDGNSVGNVWQFRDITRIKQTEKDLLHALETERNYNELNKNFVSMVSHEFRTPLTSIHSTSELLLQFGERFTLEDIQKRVRRIYDSSIRMDKLIEDVLTIGKLESENSVIENKPFKFSDLLKDTIQLLKVGDLKDRKVEYNIPENEPFIVFDQHLIDLIVRNLLENAAKYSDSDSLISIEFSSTQEGFSFSCTDRGIGIPASDLKQIFESFKRGTNTQGFKGTGLGLPIVKKSIDRLGGSISVDSVLGEGTTVQIQLPAQK